MLKVQGPRSKVQNKHSKQLNFTYQFVLEHTRGRVRPASLWFARKTLNFWYQSKFRMTVTVWNWSVKTVLLGSLQTWFEPYVSEDAWWLSNSHQVVLTNYKRNKCQFHWTVFITILETRQSIFSFKEVVMRADFRSVLFSWYSHINITYFWRNRGLADSCQLCVDGLLSRFKPLNVGLRESIMTPKFQCCVTCIKGPDREMLACESTTPRRNPHLEDKPTVGKPACEI